MPLHKIRGKHIVLLNNVFVYLLCILTIKSIIKRIYIWICTHFVGPHILPTHLTLKRSVFCNHDESRYQKRRLCKYLCTDKIITLYAVTDAWSVTIFIEQVSHLLSTYFNIRCRTKWRFRTLYSLVKNIVLAQQSYPLLVIIVYFFIIIIYF